MVGSLLYNASDATKGCKKAPVQDLVDSADKENTSYSPDGGKVGSFVMVERGDCTFVTKSRNIAHAGGSLAIVIDDKAEVVKDILMSDDGTGAGLNMPSMLIGKKHGDIIKSWMRTATPADLAKLRLKAVF